MQSFLKKKKIQDTQTLIKESLLQQLSYSVKEIQLLISKKNEIFSTNEECNSFVIIIEAIFLHSLKTGIIKMALNSVTGGEDTKPQPSFWQMIKHYIHKNTLSTINGLSQIKSDVGRCRVWIRMALNEGELTSYFKAMEKERRILNSYYSHQAFLRDRETCDTTCKLLEGILGVQFQIPINSSLLNSWMNEPLMLSGLWLPPMKTPLSTGVDVAEKITDNDESDEDDSCSIKTSSSVTTLSTILALDESQALKLILETPLKKLNKDVNVTKSSSQVSQTFTHDNSILEEENDGEPDEKYEKTIQKDLEESEETIFRKEVLLSDEQIKSFPEKCFESQHESGTNKEGKLEDYNILLEKAGFLSDEQINYESKLKRVMEKQSEKQAEQKIVNVTNTKQSIYNSYLSIFYKIVSECNLKEQKYTCADCQLSIGLTFGEARLCHFTGKHYCDKCHLNDTNIIPSRLIFNWDHRKYPVCKNAHKYLNDVCRRFLIDVKKINPKLYAVVKDMKELRQLRVQLNMLRAYFYTCKEPILLELQRKVTPREYIYEFIDHYSINDLCQVPSKTLTSELSSIVSFGRNHVVSCWLCSQKGFVCEICKKSKIIYPFDMTETYRCTKCNSLYHHSCLSSSKNCPKCKRMKNRNSESLEPTENTTK